MCAVYNFYLGYFDGVPANLNPLTPQRRARNYMNLAGGPDGLMRHAKHAMQKGDYRWAAELLNHYVFAHPKKEARALLADAYEQMGYQAESGLWRNFYLTGAKELREGVDGAGAHGQPRYGVECADFNVPRLYGGALQP